MHALRRVPLGQRRLLAVTGTDRREFLQGLVTGDLRRLSRERAIWAALLTPQGKYLFDFFLVEGNGDGLLLETDAARAEALRTRLSMYRLRAKVEILDLDDRWEVTAIFGERAPSAFGLPDEPGAARPLGEGVLFVDPRHARLGLRLLLPRGATPPAPIPAAEEVPFAAYEDLRLGLGVPDSRDLVAEKSLPLEFNFFELGGVAFDKGCYIGQEVTARMKHRGRLRKRLLPVEIHGPAKTGDMVVAADGREAGVLRSVLGGRGLALLRLDHLRDELRTGEAVIVPRPPEWLKLQE